MSGSEAMAATPVVRWEAPPAFEDFVRARHVELLRFAHVLCGDAHLAADLVQDALVSAGTAWRRIRRHDDPEGYVRRSIVNRYLNRGRALRRERLVADVPEGARSQPEPVSDDLWQLLATLPRQQRAVLVLRFYEDLTEAQVALVLGCSVGTVKSTGARGLAKLRTHLGESTPERDEP